MEENHTRKKESNLIKYNQERLKSYKLGIPYQSNLLFLPKFITKLAKNQKSKGQNNLFNYAMKSSTSK